MRTESMVILEWAGNSELMSVADSVRDGAERINIEGVAQI
jgi:hypothetical protein